MYHFIKILVFCGVMKVKTDRYLLKLKKGLYIL